MNEKRIIVLGATGSIGINCFDAVRNLGNGYRIVGASCHSRVDELLNLAREFDVAGLAVSGHEASDPRITWTGPDAVRRLLEETEADIVVNGIAGSSGLMPSVWSLQTGKDLALANKETIVMAGRLIQELADRNGRRVLPVDSEHSAIFHLLQHRRRSEVRRIFITASGGPFRTTPLEKFSGIKLKDALRHPTWE
ncbi:MAG: 1-deoxy-D-xylulose-5-phosphate reductoisomerase, partial [Sediminispirochaetaceae bacterium]